MILLIGGVGQGKLDYACARLGLGPDCAAYDPEQAAGKPVFAGLERWVRAHPEAPHAALLDALLAENPGVVILCDEVGCGVVPLEPGERVWRETVGRLCGRLAQKAERVERIFCGLPMVLKGEVAWS